MSDALCHKIIKQLQEATIDRINCDWWLPISFCMESFLWKHWQVRKSCVFGNHHIIFTVTSSLVIAHQIQMQLRALGITTQAPVCIYPHQQHMEHIIHNKNMKQNLQIYQLLDWIEFKIEIYHLLLTILSNNI